MTRTILINMSDLNKHDYLTLNAIVKRNNGEFYDTPLSAFADEEAKHRIADYYGISVEEAEEKYADKIDSAFDELEDYLLENETAMNYDVIEDICTEDLEDEVNEDE